jgi:NTE family protein
MMKIALSLSGGGLRAAAQLGALKFLEEEGVQICAVAGSSAGAMLALMIASGKTSEHIYAFLKEIANRDLFRLSKKPGFFSLKNLEKKLAHEVRLKSYDQMAIPLFTCVTDVNTGKTHYLNCGNPIVNTIASSSLTPIFEAKEVDGKWYIDGGFSDNLPVRPLKALGYKVLAIDVNPIVGGTPKNFKSLLVRSLLIMLNANVKPSKKMADAYLDIKGVARMHLFNFKEIDAAYEAGYRETKAQWSGLREKLV